MQYHENIDNVITIYLRKTGKTQEQLANEIGLNTGEALSMKRAGKTEFKLSEVVSLCEITDTPIDTLVFG